MLVAKYHGDVIVDTWDGESYKIKVRIEFLLQKFSVNYFYEQLLLTDGMTGNKKKQCRKRRHAIGSEHFKSISDIPLLKLPPHF